jgi:hypothetical protein
LCPQKIGFLETEKFATEPSALPIITMRSKTTVRVLSGRVIKAVTDLVHVLTGHKFDTQEREQVSKTAPRPRNASRSIALQF